MCSDYRYLMLPYSWCVYCPGSERICCQWGTGSVSGQQCIITVY